MAVLTPTKKPWKSKLNWISLASILAGLLVDPRIVPIFPETWAPTILQVAGIANFVISNFFTKRSPDSAAMGPVVG